MYAIRSYYGSSGLPALLASTSSSLFNSPGTRLHGGSVMPKRSIRQRLLLERRQCADADCRRWSRQVQERFLDGDLYRRAGCLGVYSPLHNEVQTDLLAQRARVDGKP